MKMKLTSLMFGLLLAVGWTSNASAQALPEGGFTERMGLPDAGVNTGIVNAKMIATMPMMTLPTGESTQMSAPAQAPKRATGVSSVVHDKAYYQKFKYSWTGADGVLHENVDPTEPATDPYQIYELLRFVYGNPNFPGPTYSAYTPNYLREDPVYYGAINGGWDITAGTGGATVNTQDITINVSNYSVIISSIKVYDANNNELVNWDAQTAVDNGEYTTFTQSGNTYYRFILPEYLTTDNGKYYGLFNSNTQEDPVFVGYLVTGTDAGTLTIPYSYLNGATNVRVEVTTAYNSAATDVNHTLNVNGQATSSDLTSELTTYSWDLTVAEQPEQGAYVQGTVVAPYEDGYTVVVVALKDRAEMQLATEEWPANSSHFETKAQLIEYFGNNIEYVRLLTDGLRIGSETDHTTGTVFNCDGRLNRFFFLGKGQSRKKAPRIQAFIDRGGTIRFQQFTANNQSYTYVNYQDWFGEDVAFEEMFEQFSPTSTTVSDESQTLDLFDKLREGNVYDVQHDCGSVMQAEHEFSLAGKNGTEHYPFSGLNFFVPDYRLLFWTTTTDDGYTVDGRDNVPYQSANTNYTTPEGSHGSYFSGVYDLDDDYYYPTWYSAWSAYYAVYNKTYAPKIGIYKITLDAVATFVGDATNPDHNPSNHNYNVTLTWVSSLDQMSGHTVPQTYTMYLVDENGNRTQLEPEGVKFYDIDGNELDENNQNPFYVTQAVYAVPQNEHSYTIEYQVDGVAQEGPGFHATSNRASVVIPGWNDFVGLKLDHHESDFDPEFEGKRVNFYRNFVAMVNEDIYNGLTISKITGYNEEDPSTPLEKMDKFNLYRFLPDAQGNPTAETKVATITFDQASADQVHFNVAYENQEIENYTLQYKDGNQTYTVNNAYSHENLNIPTSGWVRVKGNGDIVIWPNRYTVNIKSITVKNGNTTITSWNASSASIANQNPNLPTSPYKWETSPGSDFLPYVSESNEQVCYMEGGGYLYIPGVLKTYPNATVVIEAFGEAGNVNRISVNDASKDILATSGGALYTWPSGTDPLSPNAAPRRATTNDVTLLPSYGATTTISSGNVTLYSAAGYLGYFSSNYIELYGSTNTISTSEGTITKIVFNGYDTSYPVSGLSTTTGNYSTSGNVGTWTGDATSVTFSAAGYVDVSSIVVTVTTGGDTPTEGKIYEKVTSPSQLVAGKKYILVYETTPAVMGAITTTGTKYGLSITGATISGNTINTSGANGVAELTLGGSTGAWTFDMGNGAYLYWSSGNTLTTNSDATNTNAQWIATSKGGGYVLTNKNTNTRILQYNSSSGQERFACYTSAQQNAFLYVEKSDDPTPQPGVDGGLLRLHVLFADQLKEEIPDDNSHPDAYGYILRYEPESGNKKESGTVRVNIQKTDCEVMGYYTLGQIDRDTDRKLTMDVLTADVQYNLSSTNDLLNYYYLQGANSRAPELGEDYLSQLHRQEDFTYREMLETSPEFDQVVNSGEHHYFNSTDEPIIGTYNDGSKYMSYAPSVSTWGIQRRYYELDGKDNTYGGPIWQTAVGKAQMGLDPNQPNDPAYKPIVEFQEGWNTSWKVDGKSANLYMLDNINAIGYLPPQNLTKVKFEPYMFRVFVESENGLLRPFKYVKDDKGNDVITADEEGSTTGPTCVWSGLIKRDENGKIINDPENGVTVDSIGTYGPYTYTKMKVGRTPATEDNTNPAWDKDKNNAIFGALDELIITGYDAQGKPILRDIPEEDLRIFVRFYFSVEGEAADHTPWTRAEGSRSGNGAESAGSAAGGVATGVHEIQYLGEIVSQTYYNVQGMVSDKPFDGVNIVVTRFGNGTTSVSKIVR